MQSFLGLALTVSEIIRGSLKTPVGPLNSKKMPGMNWINILHQLGLSIITDLNLII